MGFYVASIVDRNGKIWVSGNNDSGQLSQGTQGRDTCLKDFNVMLNDDGSEVEDGLFISKGSLNSNHTLIVKKDGTIWLSGLNNNGQFGDLSHDQKLYLTKMGETDVKTNGRNEYIRIGETLNIDVLSYTDFNVFIKDAPIQAEWEWKSSNEDVAVVDSNGKVTGKSLGYTTITGENKQKGIKTKVIVNVYNNKTNAITVPQVSNGEEFTVMLKEDGTVWTTGRNYYGQLGIGTTGDSTNVSVPVQVKINENKYLTSVKQISAGPDYAAALTTDGNVYVWGRNEYGVAGQGDDTANLAYATKMKGLNGNGYLENIVQISAGRHEILALSETGEVYGSGYGAHLIYLDNNGSRHNFVTKVNTISNCVKIETGVCSAYGIMSNGETWSWGHNPYGELGNATYSDGTNFRYPLGNDIVDVSSGGNATLVIKEDGKVYGTGYNNYGQLGVGDKVPKYSLEETKFNLDGIKAKYILMQEYYVNILAENGKVYVIGRNDYGQLSIGNITHIEEYNIMKDRNGNSVEDGLFLANSASGYGNSYQKTNVIIRKDGTVWASGYNGYGQCGNTTKNDSSYITKMGEDKIGLDVRNEYIQVNGNKDINILSVEEFNLFNKSEVNQSEWKWKSLNEDVAVVDENSGMVTGKSVGYTTITGENINKHLKVRAIINVYNDKADAITVPQTATGNSFSVILKEDGTVWTTGLNNYGQLGNGTKVNSSVPVQVKTDVNTYLTDVKQITAGEDFVAALTSKGKVYAWGRNNYGQ